MILWPSGTGLNRAPPQLLFLCWSPGCSLLLSLTCSMALPLPCVPTRPGLGFFNYFREACSGNTRMSHVCRLHVHRGRLESTAATSQAQVCGTGVEGDRRAARFVCLSPSSSNLPLLPSHPLEKDFYPRHAALHWVTSLLLRVPTLPGLAGFSGSRFAGGSKAVCVRGCRYPQQPYCSLALP